MATLYTATVLFVASSLAIALNVAYGSMETAGLPSGLALLGGLFLLVPASCSYTRAVTTCASSSATSTSIAFLEDSYEKGKKEGVAAGRPGPAGL